jgi:hypothetical protein
MIEDDESFQSELLADLSTWINNGRIRMHSEDRWLVDAIKRRFPIVAGRIAWENVPNSTRWNAPIPRLDEPAARSTRVRNCLKDAALRLGIDDSQNVFAMADSFLTVMFEMPFSVLLETGPLIFELPYHAYVAPRDVAWCINHTMEGDVYAGLAVK